MRLRIKVELDQKALHVVDYDKKGEAVVTILLKGAVTDAQRDKLVQALAVWTKWMNFAEVFR